jgi:hypothetical protein
MRMPLSVTASYFMLDIEMKRSILVMPSLNTFEARGAGGGGGAHGAIG